MCPSLTGGKHNTRAVQQFDFGIQLYCLHIPAKYITTNAISSFDISVFAYKNS
jgi:hypothetical protein